MTADAAPEHTRSRPLGVLTVNGLILAAAGAIVLLVLACLVAFRMGERHSGTQVLTGRAHVGLDEASVKVDGWWYGLTPSAVMWYDDHGAAHDGGTAPCLTRPGTEARIQFGAVPASGRDSDRWREVVWVHCLSS